MPAYDHIAAFDEGVAIVERDGAFGLIDTSGNEILSPGQFSQIWGFREGLSLVVYAQTELHGYLDPSG